MFVARFCVWLTQAFLKTRKAWAYAQQLLHARIEVVIGKIKQRTMKTWKNRKKMMKKYHQQKLAEHEADDVF